MGKPQFFIQNKGNSEPKSGNSVNWTKWLLFTLVFVLVIGVLGYGGLKVKGALDSVSHNWQEIQFAMQKPNVVKAVREDYQTKSAKLDKEYTQKEKTSDEVLIDEVVKRLKTADSLK